jgi:chlorite dismutase
MFGRTYTIGYEDDLERVLIRRPIERVTDPSLRWAVWYPVRRSGAFEQLPPDEQRTILMEHGGIGRAYGSADLVYDIRLACFGLDKNDNDFVIGLLGHELFPLSAIVERMRKTRQTSQYLTDLGPFFVGKAIWQSKVGAE